MLIAVRKMKQRPGSMSSFCFKFRMWYYKKVTWIKLWRLWSSEPCECLVGTFQTEERAHHRPQVEKSGLSGTARRWGWNSRWSEWGGRGRKVSVLGQWDWLLESVDLGGTLIPRGLHRDGLGALWGPDCKIGRGNRWGASWVAITGMGQVIKCQWWTGLRVWIFRDFSGELDVGCERTECADGELE